MTRQVRAAPAAHAARARAYPATAVGRPVLPVRKGVPRVALAAVPKAVWPEPRVHHPAEREVGEARRPAAVIREAPAVAHRRAALALVSKAVLRRRSACRVPVAFRASHRRVQGVRALGARAVSPARMSPMEWAALADQRRKAFFAARAAALADKTAARRVAKQAVRPGKSAGQPVLLKLRRKPVVGRAVEPARQAAVKHKLAGRPAVRARRAADMRRQAAPRAA